MRALASSTNAEIDFAEPEACLRRPRVLEEERGGRLIVDSVMETFISLLLLKSGSVSSSVDERRRTDFLRLLFKDGLQSDDPMDDVDACASYKGSTGRAAEDRLAASSKVERNLSTDSGEEEFLLWKLP